MQAVLKLRQDSVHRTNHCLVERRGSRRRQDDLKVMAMLASRDPARTLCRLIPMRLTDHSASGLGLRSDEAIPLGSAVTIHCPSLHSPGGGSQWHGIVACCDDRDGDSSESPSGWRVGVELMLRRAA